MTSLTPTLPLIVSYCHVSQPNSPIQPSTPEALPIPSYAPEGGHSQRLSTDPSPPRWHSLERSRQNNPPQTQILGSQPPKPIPEETNHSDSARQPSPRERITWTQPQPHLRGTESRGVRPGHLPVLQKSLGVRPIKSQLYTSQSASDWSQVLSSHSKSDPLISRVQKSHSHSATVSLDTENVLSCAHARS